MSDVQNAFPSCSNKRFQKSFESKTEEREKKNPRGSREKAFSTRRSQPRLRFCVSEGACVRVCVPRVGNTLHDGLVPPHGHAGVLGGDDD